MRQFCRFKHWQFFLIWIISGTLFVATIESSFWVLTLSLYDFVIVGWIYSIGKVTNNLNGKLRIENYHEDLWFVLFFISFIPLGYISHSSSPISGLLTFGIVLFESISAFKLINFSAKALGQNDQKKNLKFVDYISEFFLIVFFVIGLWIIQPKMNKIIEKQ